MNHLERPDGGHIERKEQRRKIAPAYRDIYPDTPHFTARIQVNAALQRIALAERGWRSVNRQRVPDALADWNVPMPHYDPPFLDMPRGATRFRKIGDMPQPDDPRAIQAFDSLEAARIIRDADGYPLNPLGRTGLRGRGMLDKWGPTHAADPVLTRHQPGTGRLQVLLIQRSDTGEWAFPGGKLDPSETPAEAAGRELGEEAGVAGVTLDFTTAEVIYAGYIDDARNTDNAWMESTALHLHLDDAQAAAIRLQAGSDAVAAQWADIDRQLFTTMLRAHADVLALAVGQAPRS